MGFASPLRRLRTCCCNTTYANPKDTWANLEETKSEEDAEGFKRLKPKRTQREQRVVLRNGIASH